MKPYEKIVQNFRDYVSKNGSEAYRNLKTFFKSQKQEFYTQKN